MVAKIAGQDVRANKENATTAASMATAAEKDGQLEMDAMAPLEEKTDTNVFWNQVVVPMNAKIHSLQIGRITTWQTMVTFVITTLDLGNIVIQNGGSSAMVKNVENFVKRHVTNANHL